MASTPVFFFCFSLLFFPPFIFTSWRLITLYYTPVFLSGEFHQQRNLEGYSPWGGKESNTTDRLTLSPRLEEAERPNQGHTAYNGGEKASMPDPTCLTLHYTALFFYSSFLFHSTLKFPFQMWFIIDLRKQSMDVWCHFEFAPIYLKHIFHLITPFSFRNHRKISCFFPSVNPRCRILIEN